MNSPQQLHEVRLRGLHGMVPSDGGEPRGRPGDRQLLRRLQPLSRELRIPFHGADSLMPIVSILPAGFHAEIAT
jgi:hypothetical protein